MVLEKLWDKLWIYDYYSSYDDQKLLDTLHKDLRELDLLRAP